MTVELEKRYTYIQKFFESLSDEEFVRMMIECGIKSSKKTGREWLYKGVLSKLHEIVCVVVDEIRKGEIMNCIRVMVFIGIIFILTAIVIFCICYLKKIIIKIYNKWEKRGMLLQNIAYPTGEIYKDINCKREIYFFFSSANRSSRFAINLRELLSC